MTKEVRELYPEIEWMRIIRSRHILVHDYAGIAFEIVWRIIEQHLPHCAKHW
ncbi:HepT-like ribonuclease domain-containing protein [Dyadobacter crusticola]|uniref:HepT-like ribonuclease domain-containing protein n=1 Tax=Dyadobacter crusticola TaxID=292407 RepID=UPI0035B69869